MKTKYVIAILLSLAAVALTSYCFAEPYSLITPTEREDGTPLDVSEIKGFNMYCGTVVGDYVTDVFFEGATLPKTTVNITTLPPGISYCVFTTVDIDGREGMYTNEIKFVNNAKANPLAADVPLGQTVIFTSTIIVLSPD